MTLTLPTLDQIRAIVARFKGERRTSNPGSLSAGSETTYATAYGPPDLKVWTAVSLLPLAPARPWDRSLDALEEAAALAAPWAGWVVLDFPIVLADPAAPSPGRYIDDGFALRVWPSLAVREHNDWIPVDP